jgi:hypothetical protein
MESHRLSVMLTNHSKYVQHSDGQTSVTNFWEKDILCLIRQFTSLNLTKNVLKIVQKIVFPKTTNA